MMRQAIATTVLLAMVVAGAAAARELQINPITPEVKDKIRQSAEMVGSVDDQIAPAVMELEKLYRSYEPCASSPGDRGCVQLRDQVRDQWKVVLQKIDEVLPRLKKTVGDTAQGLGASIQKQTRRQDIRSLYAGVSGKTALPKSRGPLSRKLARLIETLGTASDRSILEASLQTQADLIAADATIGYMEGRVTHLLTLLEFENQLPILSDEMSDVMRGVADLFGYEMDFVPEVPTETAKTDAYGWN